MINKQEYILCAAIWYKDFPLSKPEILDSRGIRPYNVDKGVVMTGWRHANCILNLAALTGLRSVPNESGESIQGFLTSKNRFLDRVEAMNLAIEAGQISDKESIGKQLYSEDIY